MKVSYYTKEFYLNITVDNYLKKKLSLFSLIVNEIRISGSGIYYIDIYNFW